MFKYAIAFTLISTAALAQSQAPDATFLQHAITALQAQRNAAFDQAASQQARADKLEDDLKAANAKIKELSPKEDDKK